MLQALDDDIIAASIKQKVTTFPSDTALLAMHDFEALGSRQQSSTCLKELCKRANNGFARISLICSKVSSSWSREIPVTVPQLTESFDVDHQPLYSKTSPLHRSTCQRMFAVQKVQRVDTLVIY